jgi:hypothetical protein
VRQRSPPSSTTAAPYNCSQAPNYAILSRVPRQSSPCTRPLSTRGVKWLRLSSNCRCPGPLPSSALLVPWVPQPLRSSRGSPDNPRHAQNRSPPEAASSFGSARTAGAPVPCRAVPCWCPLGPPHCMAAPMKTACKQHSAGALAGAPTQHD